MTTQRYSAAAVYVTVTLMYVFHKKYDSHSILDIYDNWRDSKICKINNFGIRDSKILECNNNRKI